ncbi:hypothetical protein XCR1_1160034 [Xenorhabdus cabanillasii JM26]|uniref:Uncharacterized protein n=1 Tax=Xenorhabdus cabanillasii JM26 TaxID=1427517 RepID=W1IPI7_9GAMM|nr:hypothetical protein XCR1_1160034 [Xenorhabdus cabanillasii JM26]
MNLAERKVYRFSFFAFSIPHIYMILKQLTQLKPIDFNKEKRKL